MSIEAIGVEVAKALFILALQEASKAGMSKAELDMLIQTTKAEFYENNPANIPEV